MDTDTGNELTLSDSEQDRLEAEALADVRDRYEAELEAAVQRQIGGAA